MKRKLKNKWGIILFFSFTLFLGACAGEDCETEGPSQPVMQIVTSGIETRAGVETQFVTGDEIGIYIVNRQTENVPAFMTGVRGNWLDNVKTTLSSNGIWDSNSTLIWKDKSTVVDAYAYYPWETTPSNAEITAWPVKVLADQTQAGAIRKSDFLWAKTNGISYASDNGRLTLGFKHCFAKLNISITGSGITSGAQVVSMEINGLKTTATFNMNTGAIKEVTGNVQSMTPYYSSEGKNMAEAILIPQTVEAGKFLSVTIQVSQGLKSYIYNLNETTVFKAGEEYDLRFEYTSEKGLKPVLLAEK